MNSLSQNQVNSKLEEIEKLKEIITKISQLLPLKVSTLWDDIQYVRLVQAIKQILSGADNAKI